jgi:hypothetical protein
VEFKCKRKNLKVYVIPAKPTLLEVKEITFPKVRGNSGVGLYRGLNDAKEIRSLVCILDFTMQRL